MSKEVKDMKLNKTAEVLTTLKKLVLDAQEKQANSASGVVGQETNYTSVSKETDSTNKNDVGADKQNDKQGYKQKPTDDSSEPSTPGSKSAEELAAEKAAADKVAAEKTAVDKEASKAAVAPIQTASAPAAPIDMKQHKEKAPAVAIPEKTASVSDLGSQILEAINKIANSASGVPGQETNYTSVSKDTDSTDKNDVGADKQNDKQGYKQKPSDDGSEPSTPGSKSASTEDEVNKIAAYEYGRELCVSFLKEAFASEPEIYKQAGRRDFETLIASAAAELEQPAEKKAAVVAAQDTTALDKQAEEAGEQAFAELYKRAQYEIALEKAASEKAAAEARATELTQKLAAAEALAKQASEKLAEKEAALQKRAEDEKRAQEISAIVSMVSENIFDRLKNEAISTRR